MGRRKGNPTWKKKVVDRTMGIQKCDIRGRLKVVLELGAPNAYDLHSKKTRSNAWRPRRTKTLSVDMSCPNEDNKTGKQAEEIQKY